MNEKTTIDIIVAVIALFGVIGTAIASIYAVLITAAKNKEIERLKLSNTLQIEYDTDLRTRRIESYMDLCKRMIVLAKYPEPEQLSYLLLEKLALSFREWYFQGGGLIASKTTRDCYFDLQDGLKIILQKRANRWPSGQSTPKNAIELSGYLERNEYRPAPEKVVEIAKGLLTEDDFVSEELASGLRVLGSALRTQMTEDVLTRQDPALKQASSPH